MDLFDATTLAAKRAAEDLFKRTHSDAEARLNKLTINGMGRSSASIQALGDIGLDALREMSRTLCDLFVRALGPDLDQVVAARFIHEQLTRFLVRFQVLVDRQVKNLPGSSDYGFAQQASRLIEETPSELQVAAAKVRQGAAGLTPLPLAWTPPDVSFVQDQALRKIAEVNSGEAAKCFTVGAYNASVVMAGSALEAILLDKLLQDRGRAMSSKEAPAGPLEQWDLACLIQVAEDLGGVGSATKPLADWLRGNRNLVHPGRILRLGAEIGREEAHVALGVLGLVCKELRA